MLTAILRGVAQLFRPGPATLGGIPQKQGQCRLCQRHLPVAQMVYVNHCWHRYGKGQPRVDHNHRDCAGLRLLCQRCHQSMSLAQRLAYYTARLADLGDAYPPEALIGLRKTLATAGTGELGHAGYGVPALVSAVSTGTAGLLEAAGG